ncbi:STAS domain-containing protein [Rhodococcus opacus]|uniref:STAS domain-containing protein n=1 Tax=Rhodococcus opacus TaxID=37919 RepID=UPI0002FD23A7|nr:STAS domain-containing protein [Rhodococcus opacus]MDV6241375.1 STAS domain-containing protein [Rhodococcus opacus]MDX5969792.1 STAS domain-containing protein [Rhodococcus opacus]UNN03543.1 STAS domain-containing protein [Rhodococcus opacus]CAG7598258.1 hypothetical protein E143388_04657 [Rhodococcus opacus]
MTFFHSVVDSPAQVKSWLADTWRSNTIAAGATEFRIDIDEPPGGPVVIRVAGNVDAGTVPVLSACLGESVLTGHSVVVDLLHVPFLGCPGLAALHRTATDLSAQRCRLTLAASADVRSILDRIGIGAAVPCFDTVANAFHAARSPQTSAGSEDPIFPILGPSNCSHTVLAVGPGCPGGQSVAR